MHAPAGRKVSRNGRLQLLDGVTPVHDGARSYPAQGIAPDLEVGIHRIGQTGGYIRVLDLTRGVADHSSVGTNDADPVDGQALTAGGVAELMLGMLRDGFRRENLSHLAVGAGSGTVGFEADDPVIQQQHNHVVGVVFRVHRQPINGVASDRRVTVRSNAGDLAPER
jgi:hypothetical protein